MPLRSGQEYLKKENQPFKLILLSEKVPSRQYIVNIDFDDALEQEVSIVLEMPVCMQH